MWGGGAGRQEEAGLGGDVSLEGAPLLLNISLYFSLPVVCNHSSRPSSAFGL